MAEKLLKIARSKRASLEETIRLSQGIVVRRKGTPEGTQMIVDSSAIIAILRNGPDAGAMIEALQEASSPPYFRG